MDVVARDAFLEALDDPELVIHIQAQKPTNIDLGVRVVRHTRPCSSRMKVNLVNLFELWFWNRNP